MDNSQILTIALAAVPNMLAVLAGILINNSRLSDTNARIADLRAHSKDAHGEDLSPRDKTTPMPDAPVETLVAFPLPDIPPMLHP